MCKENLIQNKIILGENIIMKNKKIYIFAAIALIFFGALAEFEFAVDTYATLTFSTKEFINQFASSGRFILVFVGVILEILKLKSEVVYNLSYITALICMIISMYKLHTIIKDDVKNEILKILIPVLIVLNAFSLELFLFIEKGIMLFGVMMCIFAVERIKQWLKEKNKKDIILAFIFMLLANFSYQGVVGIFVAISVIYIVKYSKTIKDFIINNVVVILNYGIPAIIDYILIKIFFSSSRVSGKIVISESLRKIYENTKSMIVGTYSMLPKYLFAVMILVMIGLIVYQIICKKEDTKNKLIDIAKMLYIIFAVILATIAPQIMQNTDSIWFVARSTYTYASLFGVLVLYLCVNFKDIKIQSRNIIFVLSAILLIVQFNRFNIIETSRYKTNEMDYEVTKNITSKIKEYEKETGNKIEKIALYKDKSMSYAYDGIFSTGDTNIKAYSKDWCIIYILKYYSGINLINSEKNPEIEKEFQNKDWDKFDEKQLIFDGDTMHLCKY